MSSQSHRSSSVAAKIRPSCRHAHQHQHHSASVLSPSSLSRTRRYNSSHVGGASYVPQNEFPVFSHDGDVEVVVRVGVGPNTVENKYLLHRHTLTRCSGFFEVGTSSEWSKARPSLADGSHHDELVTVPHATDIGRRRHRRRGGGGDGDEDEPEPEPEPSSLTHLASTMAPTPNKRWRYELDAGTDHDDIPMLVQKDAAQETTRPSLFGNQTLAATRHVSFSHSVANLGVMSRPTQADEDLLRDYDNLFRIFYNYAPVLDDISVADAYVQCKSLLALADQYDALSVVGPRVDHHLLQFQSRLWKQIAKYPISYLRLGYLARSKLIFQEALVHVVGQWPTGERNLRAALPDIVIDIIEDKVDELDDNINRIEASLFRLSLTTPKGDRVNPTNNYLDWLVVSLFRQWLADNTPAQPPPPPPGITTTRRAKPLPNPLPPSSSSSSSSSPPSHLSSALAYRTLGSAHSDAFLPHDECKKFLKLTPDLYTRENLRRFEKRLDELKTAARHLVRPLLGSTLELDLAKSSRTSDAITYLTCTAVEKPDLPWPLQEWD